MIAKIIHILHTIHVPYWQIKWSRLYESFQSFKPHKTLQKHSLKAISKIQLYIFQCHFITQRCKHRHMLSLSLDSLRGYYHSKSLTTNLILLLYIELCVNTNSSNCINVFKDVIKFKLRVIKINANDISYQERVILPIGRSKTISSTSQPEWKM